MILIVECQEKRTRARLSSSVRVCVCMTDVTRLIHIQKLLFLKIVRGESPIQETVSRGCESHDYP